MDDEKLIEHVRKYPELYDMSHQKYLDTKFKTSIWTSIGNELNKTANDCKTRWTNIRDQFKKNLNKRQLKSGQAATKVKKYKCEDLLQFLVAHIQDREVIENILNDNDSEDYTDTPTTALPDAPTTALPDAPTTALPDAPITALADTLTTTIADTPTTVILPQNATISNTSHNSSQNTSIVKKNKARARSQTETSSQPSASASLMKYIIENKKKTEEVDHIDAFFKGLIPTVKRFSPYYQHLAKGRIFQVVQDLEWEWLSSDPNPNSYISSSLSSSPLPSTSTPTPPPPPPPPLTQQDNNSIDTDISTFFTEFNPSSITPQNSTNQIEES